MSEYSKRLSRKYQSVNDLITELQEFGTSKNIIDQTAAQLEKDLKDDMNDAMYEQLISDEKIKQVKGE
jgi:phage-related tail protein